MMKSKERRRNKITQLKACLSNNVSLLKSIFIIILTKNWVDVSGSRERLRWIFSLSSLPPTRQMLGGLLSLLPVSHWKSFLIEVFFVFFITQVINQDLLSVMTILWWWRCQHRWFLKEIDQGHSSVCHCFNSMVLYLSLPHKKLFFS